ncbi:hypothetical protein R5R35_011794 [Gryllus longicercus]|uniref:Protein tincar n=1 Tax=Gryllus longicercus TaxID=2509291 RepID=A0AAN9VR12_9ORTH
MSMTGSLMQPYDNNNDVAAHKGKARGGKAAKVQIQSKQSGAAGGAGGGGVAGVAGAGGVGVPGAGVGAGGGVGVGAGVGAGGSCGSLGSGSSAGSRARKKGSGSACFRAHFNSLWSVWYGLCAAGVQAYVAAVSAERYLGVASRLPPLESHAYIGLTGAAVLLLPFFLTAAVFKIGNLANDGFKLGRHLSTCSADPPGVLLGAGAGVLRSLWQHGGPTAPFLHLCTAFCLLLPKLLAEARLIQLGHLPPNDVWRTDLDFLLVHSDRLVVLSFVSNSSNPLPTPLPSSVAATGAGSSAAATTHPAWGATTTTASAAAVGNESGINSLPLVGDPLEGGVELRTADWGPVSAEYLNYGLALLVYAVRYPAVFWHTNKAFGTLFSFQLLVNGLQSMVAYAGMCVLYKVQVLGAKEALPMLHLRTSHNVDEGSPFILNTHVTLALFILSNVLILASSLVLYLYGYGRFTAFLDAERERRVIILRQTRSGSGWGYFTHCAALCVLLAIAVCNAPLLYDYTVVYRCSLDNAVLACVIGAILHLFLWVLLWLILTIKQRWAFKLRVTVGRAAVKSARSIRLVTDVDLVSARDGSGSSAPLLVVGNGRTYTISDTSPKKAIMSVIQKAALDRKAKASQGSNSNDGNDEGEEQIYWLRPKPPSPKTSPDSSSDRLAWLNRKLSNGTTSTGTKHKVTFDDSLSSSSSRKGKSLLSKSPKSGSKGKNKNQRMGDLEQLSESEDDGDYATLRELPLMSTIPSNSEDTASEDNKLIEASLPQDTVLYACTNKKPPTTCGEFEEPSPPVTPEPNEANTNDLPPPPVTGPVTVNVHGNAAPDAHQFQGSVTPRCLRRADSGMPHEELTPRSDSVSTESSGSGGSPPCGNHSETSSGVHSNSSAEGNPGNQNPPGHPDNNGHLEMPGGPRRSTSVDDLTTSLEQPRVQPSWRSFSLQRNVAPPTSTSPPNVFPMKANSVAIPNGNGYGAPNGCVGNMNNMNGNGGYAASGSNMTSNGQPVYGFGNVGNVHAQQYNANMASNAANTNGSGEVGPMIGGCPAVLLESTTESTVVIRRKNSRPKTTENGQVKEEPFGRSTNMRMTSFTDSTDNSRLVGNKGEAYPSASSTLPHYPTQPVTVPAVYPHCSTMPLPSSSTNVMGPATNTSQSNGNSASGSCHSFPRQHTTIPTHHNGVRLFAGPNPYAKRFPPFHHQGLLNGRPPQVMLGAMGSMGPVSTMGPVGPVGPMGPMGPMGPYGTMPVNPTSESTVQNSGVAGHHTFPHLSHPVKYNPQQHLHKQDRDSANFSMASSGDSDQYLQQT